MINYYQTCKAILNNKIIITDIIKTLKSIGLYNYSTSKFILCNATQNEPGAFIDKYLILNNSHKIIEGILILAICVKAKIGYICIRHDFIELIAALEQAVASAYNNRLLGKNILNSGYDFDLYIIYGSKSYISGDDSAILEYMEGKLAIPRLSLQNNNINTLYGYPVSICNVENLVNITDVLQVTNTNQLNYRLFSISGHVNKSGVYRLPLGSLFKDLLIMAGGIKNNKRLKAVMPGGYSSIVMPENIVMQFSLDNSAFSSNLIVMDETTCMVEVLLNIIKFYMNESCGQHVPCKEAIIWIYKIVNKIYNNLAYKEDLEILQSIINNLQYNNICSFSNKVSNVVKSFFEHFKQEFIIKTSNIVAMEC